jgi:integrase
MKGQRTALTREAVERAKPEGRAYRMHDSKVPGLFLRVLPSGVKSWNVTWARNRDLAIGRFPVVTLEAARQRARQKLAEADEHGAPLDRKAGRKDLTFGDFIREQYGPHVEATAKAGRATVAAIEAQFGGTLYERPLEKIAREDFDKFKAARLKSGRLPATVNRDLDRLKAALSTAAEWGLIERNPLAGVKRIKREIGERVRHLSPAEERALRKALGAREAAAQEKRRRGDAWKKVRHMEPLGPFKGYSDHLMPMTILAINTGLRRGELTHLKWSDIDLPNKLLTVQAGYAKSGKARHIPLNSEAIDVLKTYGKQHSGKGPLFGVASVQKSWASLMAAAKIEGFRFHDLRHTFASKLVMRGVDLNTVRELLGHGDIKMTLRYAHLAPEHKAAAVELLTN